MWFFHGHLTSYLTFLPGCWRTWKIAIDVEFRMECFRFIWQIVLQWLCFFSLTRRFCYIMAASVKILCYVALMNKISDSKVASVVVCDPSAVMLVECCRFINQARLIRNLHPYVILTNCYCCFFYETFPVGVSLTINNCCEAAKCGFGISSIIRYWGTWRDAEACLRLVKGVVNNLWCWFVRVFYETEDVARCIQFISSILCCDRAVMLRACKNNPSRLSYSRLEVLVGAELRNPLL